MASTSGADRPRRRLRAAERDSLALVLNLVRAGSGATRQAIEAESGLGRAVVADRVNSLTSRGLVVEEGRAASTGGRAPRRVRFNASAGYVLSASLGTTTLGTGLADLGGRLLIEHHEPADATLGPDRVIGRIEELFDWMLREHPAAREAWAVSLAVPALVGSAVGTLGGPASIQLMPGWSGFPIHRRLGERFGALVLVANEVHLMALGELRRGHGVGRDDLLFVKIGTGIGAGVCVGGRLHRGASGYAGDIGHVAVSGESSIICRCGNTGCLEALAGGAAIARDGLLGARSGKSAALARVLAEGTEITAAHVGAAAGMGDPYSIELISRCGRLVGETLATLITGVDPSLVVVGGGVAQAGTVLLAAIRDGIYRRSRSLATENLVLVGSELGKTAGLVGGALAALDDLFDPDYLKRWIQHGRPIAEPGGQVPNLVPAAAPPDVDHVDGHADRAEAHGARPAVIDRPAPAPEPRVTVGLQRRTG